MKSINHITPSSLVARYKDTYQIDIEKIVKGVTSIELIEDQIFGYKCFKPETIAGDSDFYNQLSQFEWYYMKDKWEHQIAKKYIQLNSKVLEVGCAEGYFLQKIKDELGAEVFGIELNDLARNMLDEKGITNSGQSVEEFAKNSDERFNVVCSFQVLEHIPNVKSFLDANVKLLKDKGQLVVCVPNNDSFIKWDDNPLNMPPHHMGLWDEKSLRNIGKHYGLDIVAVEFEPLQDYHINWYYYVIATHYLTLIIRKILDFTGIKLLLKKLIKLFRKRIKGHSILIVFRK